MHINTQERQTIPHKHIAIYCSIKSPTFNIIIIIIIRDWYNNWSVKISGMGIKLCSIQGDANTTVLWHQHKPMKKLSPRDYNIHAFHCLLTLQHIIKISVYLVVSLNKPCPFTKTQAGPWSSHIIILNNKTLKDMELQQKASVTNKSTVTKGSVV